MSILKLKPVCKDYLWGGKKLVTDFLKESETEKVAESWELSCHKSGLSKIVQGDGTGKTLQEYIEMYGKKILGSNCQKFEDFPVLIKLIDAADNLSIQVHPDDTYAFEKEGEYGKTEMWYIVDCEPEAFIYYGFNKEISKDEFKDRINNNTLLEVLNKVNVHKGDVFFIEAGTIHAIGKGIVIAEIQQNSNITYRVYDYNRKDANGNTRELHVDKALEVTNRVPVVAKDAFPHLAECKYFKVDRVFLDGKSMYSIKGKVTEQSFISVLFLEGTGTITSGTETMEYKKGDSFFIPAQKGDYKIKGNCQAIITTISE